MQTWAVICIVLAAIGAVFLLMRLRGYIFLGAALLGVSFFVFTACRIPSPFKQIILGAAAVGLTYFLVLEALIIISGRTDRNPGRKYLVVLGAEVNGTQPSLSLLHRLQGALKYLDENPDARAVVSGGRGSHEEITEAECMRSWLIDNGIDNSRILCEDRSTSTVENLAFSLEIILKDGGNASDAAILSSSYHLFRAKCMARRCGYINPACVKCPPGYPMFMLGMYIREAFGLTHFWVFGR